MLFPQEKTYLITKSRTQRTIHMYIYIYIYMYIHMCVCVCVMLHLAAVHKLVHVDVVAPIRIQDLEERPGVRGSELESLEQGAHRLLLEAVLELHQGHLARAVIHLVEEVQETLLEGLLN